MWLSVRAVADFVQTDTSNISFPFIQVGMNNGLDLVVSFKDTQIKIVFLVFF